LTTKKRLVTSGEADGSSGRRQPGRYGLAPLAAASVKRNPKLPPPQFILANKCDVSVEFHAISSMLRVSKAS